MLSTLQPFRVRVFDQNGAPVAGVIEILAWQVTAGGGTVDPQTDTTATKSDCGWYDYYCYETRGASATHHLGGDE